MLASDRGRKASLFARLGIADSWVVHLVDGQLEVRRDPPPDATQLYGCGSASLTILGETDHVPPLAALAVQIAVSDLIP